MNLNDFSDIQMHKGKWGDINKGGVVLAYVTVTFKTGMKIDGIKIKEIKSKKDGSIFKIVDLPQRSTKDKEGNFKYENFINFIDLDTKKAFSDVILKKYNGNENTSTPTKKSAYAEPIDETLNNSGFEEGDADDVPF